MSSRHSHGPHLSVKKAKEFYINFIGFQIDWENDSGDRSLMYMQVSRGNLVLHLTEHHSE